MKIYNFADKHNDLDHQFGDYLNDKSIAIVGRAGLDDLDQGEWIDSHDVVVRIHSPVPYAGYIVPHEAPEWTYSPFVPEEWQSRVGSHVNVFYHKEFHVSGMEKLLPAFERAGGRFLGVEYSGNLWSYHCSEVRRLAPCRYLTNDHFLNMMDVVGDIPFAGSVAIGDILRHDIKSLYITGFPTFFTADGTLLPDKWVQKNRGMNFKNIDWLRRLCDQYDAITADSNMQVIFDHIPSTWEEFDIGT